MNTLAMAYFISGCLLQAIRARDTRARIADTMREKRRAELAQSTPSHTAHASVPV
jgi:hypothetical protein